MNSNDLLRRAGDSINSANISLASPSITLQDALFILQKITAAHCAMQEIVNRLKGEQPPRVGP